jgi:hypothetical protein
VRALRYCPLRSRPLTDPDVVVMLTPTPTDCVPSEILNVHDPAATGVTVKICVGPAPGEGLIVAIPAHAFGAVLVTVNGPL